MPKGYMCHACYEAFPKLRGDLCPKCYREKAIREDGKRRVEQDG